VTKLTDARIVHAVRQAIRGMEGLHHETNGQMAARWGVTPRRIRQVLQRWRQTGEIPTLDPNRRPRGPPLTQDEKRRIADAWGRSPRGATKIWRDLRTQGVKIPKHQIHNFLRSRGWSTPNPRKQKKRSRVRYERAHTGSLLHGDWHRTSENDPHCILWLDDASRYVLAGGEFESATGELSIQTLQAALDQAAEWGLRIEQVNTDRGSQFAHNPGQGIEQGTTDFQAFLAGQGIQHVLSRAGNPQTNGKLERLWLEYDRHRDRFRTLDDWIAWNNDQIHDSLWLQVYETPTGAFQRKLPVEVLMGLQARLEAREVANAFI
jgi:transposase InsO family protein